MSWSNLWRRRWVKCMMVRWSRRANAMSSLSRALVAVLTSGDLEQRVRDLEERMNDES